MPDTAIYRNLLDVNVTGVVLGMKHGIQALRKRGGGSICFASSNGGGLSRGAYSGAIGDITFGAPYCITSAALDQLARISAYYQTENIRCYNLKIGVYDSAIIDGFVEDLKAFTDPDANAETMAGFNFFFNTLTGDPKHIGHIYEVRPYPCRALRPTHTPTLMHTPCRLSSTTPPSTPRDQISAPTTVCWRSGVGWGCIVTKPNPSLNRPTLLVFVK